MNLYLFNPDADLALADGRVNYIPPASARQMACDLALLPAWYALPGSGVLAASAYNDVFLERMSDLWGLDAHLVTEPELGEIELESMIPWGWNAALRNRLLRNGVSEKALPTTEKLDSWRILASRERMEEALKAFRHLSFCVGESRNLYNIEECRTYVETRKQVVLKMPWSGSGKGLFWCLDGSCTQTVQNWCTRVLRTQGCVVASPIYNKVSDFALEFYMNEQGEVSFEGYSCFKTTARGAYTGNLLFADKEAEKYLSVHVPCEWLHQVCREAKLMLQKTFAGYVGYLGIDMMVCHTEDAYAIHPCVEVNLRMNMGLVASNLARRLLAPGACGSFSVEYHPSADDLRACHERDMALSPLVVCSGRISEGYLPLVPVTPSAHYRAFVRVAPPDKDCFRSHNGQ